MYPFCNIINILTEEASVGMDVQKLIILRLKESVSQRGPELQSEI